MQPYRGDGPVAPKVVEHVEVRAKRRVWPALLFVPLVLSFAFLHSETRTLRPSSGGPTSAGGFCGVPYDVHVHDNVIALRVGLAVLALYGLVLLAAPSPSTRVTIERDL